MLPFLWLNIPGGIFPRTGVGATLYVINIDPVIILCQNRIQVQNSLGVLKVWERVSEIQYNYFC